jgi:GNAT superfamily N-acetyltransferase
VTDKTIRIRPACKSDLPTIIEIFAEDDLHRTVASSSLQTRELETGVSRPAHPESRQPELLQPERRWPENGQPNPGHAAAFDEIERDPNNTVYVAEAAGVVVGTFQLTFIRQLSYSGCLVAQLESVHVRESERSRGVGRAMIEWAIQHARERGALRVQLTSNLRRTRAHEFYERLGIRATHKGMKLYLV